MILDLEREKRVDGLERCWVMRDDAHHRAPWRLLEGVLDRTVSLLHDGHTGRHGVMNEHGNLEVVGAEHRGDVREVPSYLIASGSIRLAVGINLNDAAVGKQLEAMFRRFMRKTHCMVSAHVHSSRMLISGALVHGTIHFVLRVESRAGEGETCSQKHLHCDSLSRSMH